jgi:hypothetical protein
MNPEQVVNWINNEVMRNTVYHNHKENMAWVATALFVTGSIKIGNVLSSITKCCDRIIASVLFFGFAMCAVWFICWQFKNRFVAKRKVEGLLRTIPFLPTLEERQWVINSEWLLPRFVVRNIRKESRLRQIFHSSEWASYGVILISIIAFYIFILG